MSYAITTFYHFHHQGEQELQTLRDSLEEIAQDVDLCGLIIIAPEGINSTVACPVENFARFKDALRALPNLGALTFKDSTSDRKPFARFKIKTRDEIVTAGRDDLFPNGPHKHLSPQQWNEVLRKERDDIVLLDTRNRYEWELGTFKGAVTPDIEMFSDLPQYVEDAGIPKDKKMLMFCTGGIRCEKAILQMEELGYTNVFQLDGGILKYLEEHPNEEYEGECFVFDHRVAVDQALKPSRRYHLCPHCGDPGDVTIECDVCSSEARICSRCLEKETAASHSCSKNCAHHYDRRKAA